MAELRIKDLTITTGEDGGPPVRVDVSEAQPATPSSATVSRTVVQDPTTLDLSDALGNARFSTGIDARLLPELPLAQSTTPARPPTLERVPRLYQLEFAFSRPLTGLRADAITLSFINTVTGLQVDARQVQALELEPNEDGVPASAFVTNADPFENWATSHSSLDFRRTGPREITLARGTHTIQETLIFPEGYDVVIEGGTELRLGAGVAIMIRGGLTVAGSAENRVTVNPMDPARPFGSLAVLGDGSQRTTVHFLDVSGGSEAWVDGAHFSGGMSIHYQRNVELSHVSIRDNRGDDGVNIKYSSGSVTDSVFAGNRVDQIDLDYFDGVLRNNRLVGPDTSDLDGDGLDLSGSRLVATDNEFRGFGDKGVSVGERSIALFTANTFSDNLLAIAVKDLSTAYLHDNRFAGNSLDVSAYTKKKFFGGGRVVVAEQPAQGAPSWWSNWLRPATELAVEVDHQSHLTTIPAAVIEDLRPREMDVDAAVEGIARLSDLSEGE